jgi:hypothetical protein
MTHQPTDRGKRWYFYADPTGTVVYFATFDPDNDKIPARFNGPYNDKQEAREAFYEWLESQEAIEDHEYAE